MAATAETRSKAADSIMSKVILFAPLYENIIGSYKAELYIKGKANIRKQNRLLRFIPTMFRIKKGVKEYLMETYSDLHFTAPNIYDQKVKASIGTTSELWDLDGRLLEYFYINIYASSLLYDKLLSPLAANAKKYYVYQLDSVWGPPHNRQYKIRFTPKTKSIQLVKGYMTVTDNVWSIREIRFAGNSEYLRFDNLVQMGDVGEADEFLPVKSEFDATFKLLGNVVDGHYLATLNYKNIIQSYPEESAWKKEKEKNPYDLSDSYTLRCDTNAHSKDTAYFATLRPLPLTTHEDSLYQNFFQRKDTVGKKKIKNEILRKRLEFWGEIGDALISRYTVDLNKIGSVRCSPIINPLLMSYSGSNGFSYRQEFKYNRIFTGDRLLRVVPKIGYNFTRKEFYWSVNSDFYYWPQKRASLHLSVGNGNRIYSSDVLDDLKSIPDSLFDFDQIHLDYFTDLFFNLKHSWEIVNGLTLDIGLSVHRRTEVEKSKFVPIYPDTPPVTRNDTPTLPTIPGFDPNILSKFRHTYSSFAPRIKLTWTPGQYYYMNGKRKVNLTSKYPTVSLEWERGISGVFNSTGNYERLEADYQHAIHLGLMNNFYYRFGWGAFTKQKEVYFVDFNNFTRSNLPVGWNDEIGGVFQLLDGRWYNSSREYLRAHAMYEAPFLLLKHLMKYTQYVLNERLYLNLLAVPHLKPYIELGYGIGTHVFDFGLFASFANWQYQSIGCKFTFELFNR
ncbi:DUF5686 family protein [uncultured Bacteroides sp.]|uniref:DUF5686 family protein n=1 Tax=uncultured Bacteroides sp. TaxID=162156 RepID=UPI00261FC488|nr:DUF5686 family protein [uncultured Bacteroides sp.]